MTYPRFQRARDFKFLLQTANLTLTSTSWANMPTIAALTLGAQVGDVIEASFGAYHQNEAAYAWIDAVTEVSAAPVTSFGTGVAALTSTSGAGVGAWLAKTGVEGSIGGSAFLTLASGDLSSGTVTVRMRYRFSGSPNKVLAVSGGGIVFAAKNLGPVDPH